MTLIDTILLLLTLSFLAAGFQPGLQKMVAWQVIVTPLASIIGSGFLIIAPLLGRTVGAASTWAMLGIVTVAYGIGAIIRFNIHHAEAQLAAAASTASILRIERASNVVLTIAYVVSVAFYFRLLSAFILRGMNIESAFVANSLTSILLAFVAWVGWRKGLHGLEKLEKYSVTIKLCIIGAVLFGVGHFDIVHGFGARGLTVESKKGWELARVLGGMLLVVQGFETSRYMGDEYSKDDRATGMQRAQLLAAAIYVCFVFLVTPLLHWVDLDSIDETSIIELAGQVAFILPPLLIVAAVMSQFSAAIADTVGAGGLVAEESGRRLAPRTGYILVCGLALILVWSSNIFEIVSLASRMFAGYYFAQTLVAIQVVRKIHTGARRWRNQGLLYAAAAGLLWIVIFAEAAA